MLEWSRATLAEESKVSERTIIDFERGARTPIASTKQALRTALEKAGIEFIGDSDSGEGLRFRS